MITLIVPTRNRAHTLRLVAPSFFAQDGVTELIFVSDAGDDDTPAVIAEIAQQFPQKVLRMLRNDTRLGASQSRNVGVAASTNDIILFCDDDEYLEAGYAKVLLKKLEASNLGAISGRNVYMLAGETEAQALRRFGIGLRAAKPFRALICEYVNGAKYSDDLAIPITNAIILTRKSLLLRFPFDDYYARGNGYREESDYQMNLFVNGFEIRVTNDCHSFHLPMSQVRTGGQRTSLFKRLYWSVHYTRYFFGKYYERYAQRLGLRSPRWFALFAFSIFAAYRETLRRPLHAAAMLFMNRRARLANITLRPDEGPKHCGAAGSVPTFVIPVRHPQNPADWPGLKSRLAETTSNPRRSISRSTTANSMGWSLIENGGLALVSLVSLIIYLRILSIADFGIFSTVLALIEWLGILVTMLFHNALVQRPDATDLHFNTAFTATMALSLLMVLGCWAMAPIFAAWIHQPSATRVLIWMSLIYPCSAVSATLVARQRRQFAFQTLALRSLVGRAIGGGIGIAAALMGAGLWSLVLQQILIAAIGSFVLWVSSDRTPRLQFRFGEFRQMISFGMLSVSGLLLSSSIRRVFTICATSYLGVEAAGYLNLSFRVVDMLWVIASTAVVQVALPLLAGLQFEPARLKRAYQALTQFSCLALYPCFVGLASVAPAIVEALFGHRWQPSSPYVAVLGFLVLLQAPRLASTPLLTALGKPRDSLLGLLTELIFMLGAVWLSGVPSLPWAIGIWAASECTSVLVSGWVLRRATGYTVFEQFEGVLNPLLASLLMAAVVIATRLQLSANIGAGLRLAVLIPLGAMIFAGAIFLLDRQLVKDFLMFARIAFESPSKKLELP